ncbi:hypothetical protein ACJJTC_011534 [Scirpophaga incertulas]
MSGSYMAAYSGSGGFVGQSPLETKRFDAPEGDPVVVVADCTRVMLESKILAMANAMAGELLESGQNQRWAAPTVRWTTGVPGCGIAKWVLEQMQGADSLAVTTTTEAAEDMRERLRITHNIHNRRRACAVLTAIGNRSTPNTPPGKISIDAMTVGYTKGETKDMDGIILASKHHELVVYEDRGQDLEYLLPRTNPPAIPSTSGEPLANPNISGSEELQLRMEQMERPVNQNSSANNNTSPIHATLVTLGKALLTTPHKATNNLGRLLRRLTSTPTRLHLHTER